MVNVDRSLGMKSCSGEGQTIAIQHCRQIFVKEHITNQDTSTVKQQQL